MPPKKPVEADEVLAALACIDAGESRSSVAKKFHRTPAAIMRWIADFKGLTKEEIEETLTAAKDTRYVALMRRLFEKRVGDAPGTTSFDWTREDLSALAAELNIAIPKNIGDAIYAVRHGRAELPDEVKAMAPADKAWLLLPAGKGKYRFVAAARSVVEHAPGRSVIKVPDSTPQIVARYASGDEQAVLARIRYCRLIDVFLGIAAFPLQSHMRTTVEAFGGPSQIETDDLYLGVDRFGAQYIIPIQAKGEDERIGVVQILQDVLACQAKFPQLACRAIAAKTVSVDVDASGADVYTIALMELRREAEFDVTVAEERHYQLVPSSEIAPAELQVYRAQAGGQAHWTPPS